MNAVNLDPDQIPADHVKCREATTVGGLCVRCRGRIDSDLPPPAGWPRREQDRPGVTRRSRGKGEGRGPSLLNLFPPKSREQVNRLMNHTASRTLSGGPGWYRSKTGHWHEIDKRGDAACGARVVRVAGPRKPKHVPNDKTCTNCTGA